MTKRNWRQLWVDEKYHRLFKTEASKRGKSIMEYSEELADLDKILKIDQESIKNKKTKRAFPEFRV